MIEGPITKCPDTSMLRSLVERLSRGITIRRRLPVAFGGGRLFVSPESALRFWRFDLQRSFPDLFAVVDEFVKPGHSVWDVGANMGVFLFAAAHRAGPQGFGLGIEADNFCVSLLRRSAASQSATSAPVTILPVAASDSVGVAQFAICERGRQAGHLESAAGSSQTGGVREKVTVLTMTLDALLQHFRPPDVVKVDVEGAEAAVLRGSEIILSKHRPILFIEVSQENSHHCSDMLHTHKYQIYDLSSFPRQRTYAAPWSTLAIPAERAAHNEYS